MRAISRVFTGVAGVAVVTGAIWALPGSSAPEVGNTAAGANPPCNVVPDQLPPGTYEGDVPVTRDLRREQDFGEPMGIVRYRVQETGSMHLKLKVSDELEFAGTWEMSSHTVNTVTNSEGTWQTPTDLVLRDGRITGSDRLARLVGGNGSDGPYRIDGGIFDFRPYAQRQDTIDLDVRVHAVTCEEIKAKVEYPFGAKADFDKETRLAWTAKRTAPLCEEEPEEIFDEDLAEHEVSSFDQFEREALAADPVASTELSQWDAILRTNPKSKLVTEANLTVEISTDRPVWTLAAGADPLPADEKLLLDRTVSMIEAHEKRHADNIRTAAGRAVCGVHGQELKKADQLMAAMMTCGFRKADQELDALEGDLRVIRDDTGKAVDVRYEPKTDLPPLEECE